MREFILQNELSDGRRGVVRRLIALVIATVVGALFLYPPPASAAHREVVSLPTVVAHGNRSQSRIALTFDADMTPRMLWELRHGIVQRWYNPAIIDIIRRERVPATFFVSGLWAAAYPDVVKELSRTSLFEVGNHTFDHGAFREPCFGLPPARDKYAEIMHAQAVLRRLTGTVPHLFRFPGGCAGPSDVRLARRLGVQVIGWDVTAGDAVLRDPGAIVWRVLLETRNGSIIVMHLSDGPLAPATAAALPAIISGLRERGFIFVTISELLGGR